MSLIKLCDIRENTVIIIPSRSVCWRLPLRPSFSGAPFGFPLCVAAVIGPGDTRVLLSRRRWLFIHHLQLLYSPPWGWQKGLPGCLNCTQKALAACLCL